MLKKTIRLLVITLPGLIAVYLVWPYVMLLDFITASGQMLVIAAFIAIPNVAAILLLKRFNLLQRSN